MIHIYDTVAVAAEKLRITQQERRKHVELLVGADQSGTGVDLNIVIIINYICLFDYLFISS